MWPRALALCSMGSLLLFGLALGCSRAPTSSEPEADPITDRQYLTADVWNDGQAEVAFYRVERTRDQYGRAKEQAFIMGTYLVKHRFSPADMTKVTDGTGVSSFKYAAFYELESGSYQYKRNWVVNARQNDLRPFKQSFTSFDWCSNRYREVAFPPDGPVEVRMRSDDYGNRRASFAHRSKAYPPAQLPLLIRALDFGAADTLSFSVPVADSSAYVSARAVRAGTETVETEAGAHDSERIVVHYETPVPSPIGETSDTTETYWRGTGAERRLVRMEAEGGRYQMTLVEHLRTPYWRENLWPKLDRIDDRP
ncbi:hypothetical protein GGP84_001785 [Salinibacter ruber]|uniref:DUF3108 domain-containing protein n=1 Tax=Salinibacter ruber TaxID=146919 RepID=UPI00216A31D6|nr:DUF3108 domain-containing protein [Salinibacter ruber]MCS3939159.1 hypothetical protein [Salinibacter ruber]